MKLHIWTEAREQGTTVNPGKGDGFVTVRKGQIVLLAVMDADDPALGKALRLADLMLSGDGKDIA